MKVAGSSKSAQYVNAHGQQKEMFKQGTIRYGNRMYYLQIRKQ